MPIGTDEGEGPAEPVEHAAHPTSVGLVFSPSLAQMPLEGDWQLPVFFSFASVAVLSAVPSSRTLLVDCVYYYKDAMLNRFYAICNCCSCCCGAMQAHQHGTPMLASSGYVAQVDAGLCAACGTCADYCQFAAISVDDGFARIDGAACMGCGVCVAHCVQEAISLVRDPAKGEPLEIQKLIAHAAESAQG